MSVYVNQKALSNDTLLIDKLAKRIIVTILKKLLILRFCGISTR